MPPSESRARPLASALTLGALVALFAVRYQAFLFGGTLSFRDAGFFFTPWRALLPRLWREGFPAWNDWLSNGRAFAADPNAAVFWPLSPLLFVASPTVLALANLGLLVLLFWAALRWLGLSPVASAAGSAVLLLSGVFQTLVVFIGVPAAAAPVALAVVAFGRIGFGLETRPIRGAVVGGAALALSLLGGEPVITATGGAAAVGLALAGLLRARLARPEAARRLGAVAAGALLAIGLSAVQLLPTLAALSRSARGTEMTAEHGALFWSVRPTRLLTLLEPGLTGDPFAAADAGYWGAGTFDAGNPYFYDLSLGLLPLALAAAAFADGRGRAALGIAAAAAILSFGRYLPGYGFVAARLSIFRYPEKWWLLATLAISAAAAVGVDALLTGGSSERERAVRRLRRAAAVLAVPLALLAALAVFGPPALRGALWALRLGSGGTPAEVVAAALRPALLFGVATLLAVWFAAGLAARGRLSPAPLAAFLGVLFLVDGAIRVAGTCPAGPTDLFTKETPAVAAVREAAGDGRFYDDGADLPETAARRTRDAGGLDRLRPATGTLFGIRYALENDIDRMTPRASVQAFFDAARLPWGAAKLARLRAAGVSVVRTAAPPPDPPGATEIQRDGADRVLKIDPTRPEFLLVPEAILVPDARQAALRIADPSSEPLRTSVIEVPGVAPGPRTEGCGSVTVRARSSGAASLEVLAAEPGGALVIGRTFDPNWKATLDGHPLPLFRADGFLTAAFVPSGQHTVTLRYENPLFAAGAAISLVTAAVASLLLLGGAAR